MRALRGGDGGWVTYNSLDMQGKLSDALQQRVGIAAAAGRQQLLMQPI
jgi:hypothetical protein